MNESASQTVVNRQFIVLLEAGQVDASVQAKVRDQMTEVGFQRAIPEKDQVPYFYFPRPVKSGPYFTGLLSAFNIFPNAFRSPIFHPP